MHADRETERQTDRQTYTLSNEGGASCHAISALIASYYAVTHMQCLRVPLA